MTDNDICDHIIAGVLNLNDAAIDIDQCATIRKADRKPRTLHNGGEYRRGDLKMLHITFVGRDDDAPKMVLHIGEFTALGLVN